MAIMAVRRNRKLEAGQLSSIVKGNREGLRSNDGDSEGSSLKLGIPSILIPKR